MFDEPIKGKHTQHRFGLDPALVFSGSVPHG